MTLAQLTEVLSATPFGLPDSARHTLATGITTDTRSLQPGEIFLALRGENFDGHAFVDVALEKGAIAAIVDDAQQVLQKLQASHHSPLPLLQVPDTLKAYQAIARWWRDQFSGPVIAITGSVGKTTTKELIAAVLATQGSVLKTQFNYNNEIGVPKTLLELGPEHNYAVIEMGMRGPGEIALLAQVARPDVAVITNVGTAHIGRLGSEDAIARAKCELLAEMPSTGTAILNYDNARLMGTAATVWQGKTLTYGLTGGDLQGELVDPMTLRVEGCQLPLPLPGQHNALNYLAALAVAKVLGIHWSPLMQGLAVQLPDGRAQRYTLPNDVVILDESYNAGLESMVAALHLLAQTPGQRRIAVVGTMKELGERSLEFHQQVGQVARQLQLDQILILAEEAEAAAIATGANPLPSKQFLNHEQLIHHLKAEVRSGDRLLFKASHAVGLDRVVNQLRAELTQVTPS